MFRKEKNEQNENILCLKGIRKFWIMFTIFKFLDTLLLILVALNDIDDTRIVQVLN